MYRIETVPIDPIAAAAVLNNLQTGNYEFVAWLTPPSLPQVPGQGIFKSTT